MPWASGGWARTPWTGRVRSTPPGQQTLPPPIPGGTARWVYEAPRSFAYGIRGWGGRTTAGNYPGGGVSIRPLPGRGVMQVTAWWPDAKNLVLIRIHPDGTLYPVRGGSPIPVPGTTRRNLCQNPSFEAGLNGLVPDAGTTLANPTDGTAPRGAKYCKATVTSGGAPGVVVPTSIGPGVDLTVGFDLKLSAMPTAVTVLVAWVDGSGVSLPPTTVALSANDINRSVSVFDRQVVRMSTPAAGATASVKVVAAGLPAGGSMSLDGVTVERGQTDGSFFDGGTYGATWLGVPDLSASALAPLCVIDDGECEVDVPVRYRLVKPDRAGGSMTSEAAQLDSRGVVWLTNPATPTQPLRINVEKRPRRGRRAGQGVFQAMGDPLAITVAPKKRSGWQSTDDIALWTFGPAETEQLWDIVDNNLPVLIRTPVDHNFGPGIWVSLGDLAEDPDGTGDVQQYLKLTGSWVQVAAPAV